MKNIYFIYLFLLTAACVHKQEKVVPIKIAPVNTKLASNKDSVIIDTEANYRVDRKYLKDILKKCPEFNENIPPDIAYGRHSNDEFFCEQCQDNYFILYAYFLKQSNGDKIFDARRKKLIKIYRTINGIFEGLEQGGTYFGHMHLRIIGYAEYSIYLDKGGYFDKRYNISNQKSLYVSSLKQLIIDEVNSNYDISSKTKPKLKAELLKMNMQLNDLITDYFYLKSAQEFQYSNY